MAWACRAKDDASNVAPWCSERAAEACCEPQLLQQALLCWVMVMEGRKASMVAADLHSICLPGTEQGNKAAWLFYQLD